MDIAEVQFEDGDSVEDQPANTSVVEVDADDNQLSSVSGQRSGTSHQGSGTGSAWQSTSKASSPQASLFDPHIMPNQIPTNPMTP